MNVTRIREGVYRVELNGRSEIVYVAGPETDAWAFWKGQVFRTGFGGEASVLHKAARREGEHSLTSPMPAIVRKILVEPGAAVRKGDTLIVLEAMKMELPVRAVGDAVVRRICCREGDLVQPDTVLMDLEW